MRNQATTRGRRAGVVATRRQHPWLGWLAVLVAAWLTIAGCTAPEEPQQTETETETGPGDEQATPSPDPGEPEEEALAWGPTESELEQATQIAAQMSDEQVAGQVIVARYGGADPQAAAALVQDLDLAGVILFSENIASADQVRQSAEAVQDAHSGSGRDWPAVISVDNEGGIVQRMSGASGPWTSFGDFAAAGAAVTHDPGAVTAAAQAMATELRASGLNMNFAPVADVSIGAADPTINVRAAGSEPEVVGGAVVAALAGFDAGGVLASIKHFPGHGRLGTDSHHALPTQEADLQHVQQVDLPPFAEGIDAGAPMVMMGHIAVSEWDQGVPASLSEEAYRVLREDLGFTGVAITDGLDMGALTAERSAAQIAVEALAAGADLLLTPGDTAAAHAGIVAALDEGELDRDRIDEAAGRVIAMQQWQEQIADAAGPVDPEEVDSGVSASRELSAAAITVVAGECSEVSAGERVHVQGGSADDWERFVAAAERGGLQVVALEEPADTSIRLVVSGGQAGGGDIAVALDGPWLLAGADAPTQLAAYGRNQHTMDALVEVLTGQRDPTGVLAFEVEGADPPDCAP